MNKKTVNFHNVELDVEYNYEPESIGDEFTPYYPEAIEIYSIKCGKVELKEIFDEEDLTWKIEKLILK